MINFLNPILNPKVTCDKSSTDNYEVRNLISDNFMEKSRGFLAYSTVKPPVEVEFELICGVDLNYIKLNTTVGNHKCLGVEIFAKSAVNYVSVGKAVYEENGVVFCSSVKYPDKNVLHIDNYHVCFLKNFKNLINNTKFVKIRIFRSDKYVPCLGSVEIWGSVSDQCSDVTKGTIEKLISRVQLHQNDTNSKVPAASRSEQEIPEDFKDDLTEEIMTIPMTLPSGKTIDQKTLNKHLECEKKFGRKPGDPFTGLKFTENNKPILNVALKSRIDMYILQHSTDSRFFKLDRTVGRCNAQSSQQNDANIKKIKLNDNDDISFDTSRLKFKQFVETKQDCCLVCENKDNLYVLPCQHLYCRKCLNEICVNLKCKHCCKDFTKAEVERYHT